MIKNIEQVKSLIDIVNDRRAARESRRLGLMAGFVKKYSDRPINPEGTDRSSLNILKVIRLNNDEVRHSGILAWLLDAKANHGQGDIFFKAFIEMCGINLPAGSTSNYRVRKEFPGEESIIDVFAYDRGQFLIYIENKVESSEGKDQCARELRDMHRLGDRLRIPNIRRYAIFLSPDGRKPNTGDKQAWITLSYDRLEDKFRLLIPDIKSAKVRYALEDWLEVVSGF